MEAVPHPFFVPLRGGLGSEGLTGGGGGKLLTPDPGLPFPKTIVVPSVGMNGDVILLCLMVKSIAG